MTWLVEEPLWIVVGGLVVSAILVFGWLQSGRTPILYAAIAAVALTGLLLTIERLVVTDREAVQRALLAMKVDAESDDVERLLRHVHSQAQHIHDDIREYHGQYRIENVRMSPRRKDIFVDSDNDPPMARAEFNVVVTGRIRATNDSQPVARFLIVTLYLEDRQWRVGAYEHHDAIEGAQRREAAPTPGQQYDAR
jgi:hypothetical protein